MKLHIYIVMSFLHLSSATNIVITDHVIHEVEEYYVSYCIDAYLLGLTPRWLNFNFSSPRLKALMSEMSPAILRFGGSPADWTVFMDNTDAEELLNKTGVLPPFTVFTKDDLDQIVKLTSQTGNRFLYDLDLQLRYGTQWDPTNAMQMLEYAENRGYGENLDFELGNEPGAYNKPGEAQISAEEIGQDFVRLSKLIRAFPGLQNSNLVGPDSVTLHGAKLDILTKVADKAGSVLKALTFHHYYFRGDIAHVADYLNPSHFDNLASTINVVKKAISNTSHPNMALWIGETADSWHSGTPNVTDRYVSGFLWLDKLGLAAKMGVSVVMRQTLYGHNYGLLDLDVNPNPDYWLSWVYKQLVGTKVLDVVYSGGNPTTRVYVQCTNRKRTTYPAGSLTLYALNLNTSTSDTLILDNPYKSQMADVYLFSPPPGDKAGILSKFTAVNGHVFKLSDNNMFPNLKPMTVAVSAGLKLPPLSMAFYVFPHANVHSCV